MPCTGQIQACLCFNPRARGGRDQLKSAPDDGADEFQSTRPRGARRIYSAYCSMGDCFNPRARGGRDSVSWASGFTILVSIHAPAGGATSAPEFNIDILNVSIHAPAGGAT